MIETKRRSATLDTPSANSTNKNVRARELRRDPGRRASASRLRTTAAQRNFAMIAGEIPDLTRSKEASMILDTWTETWEYLTSPDRDWRPAQLLMTHAELTLMIRLFYKMRVITDLGRLRAREAVNTVVESWFRQIVQREGEDATTVNFSLKLEPGEGFMGTAGRIH